jgi:integrative and conjugative element protein (TIGR02256 family)
MDNARVGRKTRLSGLQRASMSQLWIDSAAFNEMLDEAQRAYPLETGGVLAGYIAESGVPVVQHAVGPGSRARHKRERFEPDHEWQCRRLDEIFMASSGRAVYLGDWHTHPDGSPRMSWLDKRTLRNIAMHREASLSRPTMLIGGGKTGGWIWQGHQYLGDRFMGLSVAYEVHELRLY